MAKQKDLLKAWENQPENKSRRLLGRTTIFLQAKHPDSRQAFQ
ncbi:MAG TPA: hypothetical protein VI875_02285 [Candidatus Norongarragalinales archaeon]|nr:hypothetical protein [Candidatus Norongarragalinales archaeon]